VLASSKTEPATSTELGQLIGGYRLCARSEGKSKNTIDIVANSVGYFEGFLRSEGLPTDATRIGVREIRAFILYLQQKRCFSNHPFNRRQERGLSSHTVNCYLRSIRAFWSWLVAETLAYMYPRALEAPLDSDWTEIYLYLGTQVMGDRMPDDIRKDNLSDYQMGLLMELKRWIYRQRVRARKERHKVERAKARAEAKARAPKQLVLGL